MAVTRSSHAARDRRTPVRAVEHGGERVQRERAREQYLETLSRRLSARTEMPTTRAREHVEAVAISARKRQEPLDH